MVTGVVVAALIACLVGSLYISRGLRLSEYASYRRRGGFAHIVFTILGTLVGGWMVFGLCQVGYEAGIVGCLIGVGYAIGMVLLAVFMDRIKAAADEHKCDTIDDFIGARYGKAAQTATTFLNLILFIAIVAGQFVAMSAFLRTFAQVQSAWSIYVAFGVVIAYTAVSGFKGVLFTDMWQVVVLSVSTVVIFLVLSFTVDWQAVGSLDPNYFNGMGYGAVFIIGIMVIAPWTLFTRSDFWQRISCAKDLRVIKRALYVTAPLVLVFYVLLTMVGIYGRAMLGEGVRPDSSGYVLFIQTVQKGNSVLAQVGLSVIALGVFGALLSTADSFLNVIAIAITKLIHRRKWLDFEADESSEKGEGRSPTENQLLFSARVVTVVLGLASFAMAKAIPDIVDLMIAGVSATMVMLPAVLISLFKGTRKVGAATASIIAGFVVFAPLLFILPNPKMSFLPGVLVAAIVYFAVAPFSKDQAATGAPSIKDQAAAPVPPTDQRI